MKATHAHMNEYHPNEKSKSKTNRLHTNLRTTIQRPSRESSARDARWRAVFFKTLLAFIRIATHALRVAHPHSTVIKIHKTLRAIRCKPVFVFNFLRFTLVSVTFRTTLQPYFNHIHPNALTVCFNDIQVIIIPTRARLQRLHG